MNKTIEQWRESNKKLTQKNTYFRNQVPKLTGRIKELELKIREMEDLHRAELLAARNDAWKEKVLHDKTRSNFELLSALKMEDLLDMLVPRDHLDGSGLPSSI